VLKGSNETYSLAALLSSTADLIGGHVDDVAANGVHSGAWMVLITALSHFPKLVTELDRLGSRHNTNLTEGQLDALWTQKRWASESLVLSIPPSVSCDSPEDTGEE
jgi:hypothetical protein